MTRNNATGGLLRRLRPLLISLLTLILISSFTLAPCASAGAVSRGQAKVSQSDDYYGTVDVLEPLEGTQYQPIQEAEVLLNLFGVWFLPDGINQYEVAEWFINLPDGLRAEITCYGFGNGSYRGDDMATVSITGTPTEASTKDIYVVVKADCVGMPTVDGHLGSPDGDVYFIETIKCNIKPAPAPVPNSGELLLEKLILGMEKPVKANNLITLGYTGSVQWMISDETVIKVTGKGKNAQIKPLKTGSALLTAIFEDSTVATVPVTVVKKGEAASKLTLKGALTMKPGDVKTPKFTVGPETAADKTLKWLSADESIAKVNQTGTITAVKKGKCKVYAITGAGVRKAVNVTVK